MARGSAVLALAVTALPAVSAHAATRHHFAYTVNFLANTVTPIRVATGVARPVIPAGDHPWDIALSGNGARAYVTDIGAPNQPAGAVTVLPLRTRATLATVPVGLRPVAIGLGR